MGAKTVDLQLSPHVTVRTLLTSHTIALHFAFSNQMQPHSYLLIQPCDQCLHAARPWRIAQEMFALVSPQSFPSCSFRCTYHWYGNPRCTIRHYCELCSSHRWSRYSYGFVSFSRIKNAVPRRATRILGQLQWCASQVMNLHWQGLLALGTQVTSPSPSLSLRYPFASQSLFYLQGGHLGAGASSSHLRGVGLEKEYEVKSYSTRRQGYGNVNCKLQVLCHLIACGDFTVRKYYMTINVEVFSSPQSLLQPLQLLVLTTTSIN